MVDKRLMQIKLWPKNEEGLKALIGKSESAHGLVSVSKLANWAIAAWVAKSGKSKRTKRNKILQLNKA